MQDGQQMMTAQRPTPADGADYALLEFRLEQATLKKQRRAIPRGRKSLQSDI